MNKPVPSQEAIDEANEYLRGMAARGFVPSQETVEAILDRGRIRNEDN